MKNLKRKLRYAYEDVTEYWLARAVRLGSQALFWSLVFAVAFLLLPFSDSRRKRIAARVSNAIGKLMWDFRGVGGLRQWLPPMRNLVHAEVRDKYGRLKWADYGFNVRTNEGRDWQAHRMCNPTPPTSGTNDASYISVHNASGYTPAAGDTISTWEGNEILIDGFSRVQGVFAHTDGNANFTVEHDSYTCSGSSHTIYGAALINEDDSPQEKLFCSKNFGTPATLDPNDTLKVTWDITI